MTTGGIRGVARSLAQPVTYMGIAMLAVIYCAIAYLIYSDRKNDYNDAVTRGQNLVRIFDQSFSHIFSSVDASLLFLRSAYQSNPEKHDLTVWAETQSIRNNLTFDFTILGADGRIIDTTYDRNVIGGDRTFYEGYGAHRASADDRLVIGKPHKMRLSHRWAIPLSRRIASPDGTFAGIIVGFIDINELAKQVGKVDLGRGGVFALIGFDGYMYARVVDGQIDLAAIGTKLHPQAHILKHMRPDKSGQFWSTPGVVDPVSRLISYRTVESYPLTALVGVSEDVVYRYMREGIRAYAGIALLLTAGILIAIAFGAMRERKLIAMTLEMTEAKDALAHTNQALERRVADRTIALADEIRQREEAQVTLARANQALETRVADRTAELSQELVRREQAQAKVAQMQKMEAVGQLTAGIAHDFNNLLAVIRGSLEFVETAAARGLTAEPELVDAALRATRRGAELVRRLLTFSRQSPWGPEPTVVDQLVLDTLRLLQRTLGERIEIVTRLNALSAMVSVDRNQLANALLNLALNARDAMPEGGQLVIATACASAKCPKSSSTGEDVCISIRDTGVGMTEDVRDRVFEPFFTTKPDGLGSGLGLSMVHGFVEQSAGCIDIDSVVGDGTTITIRLPRIATAAQADEVATVPGGPAARKKEKTVLLVEDDPDVRVVTAAQLRHLGYKVHAVANAMEAIDLVESPANIDVTLTDLVLPGGIDGVALVKEAMRARPQMGVLCMSGYDPTQRHRKWLRLQNIELLEKPFSSGRLAQALDSVVPH